jgi:anti-anti-sigma regulatory factor
MSECHDIYDPMEHLLAAQVPAPGTQCHDSYPSAPSSESECTGLPHECRLQTSRHGRVSVIEVVGRLDWATEERFADLMRDEGSDAAVVIDLSATTSDGAGTGVLLAATERATKGGQQVVFVVVDPLELEVLVSVGLDFGLPIVASQTLALEWIEAQAAAADPPRLTASPT